MHYVLTFFDESNTSIVEDLLLESSAPFGTISVGDHIVIGNFAKIDHDLDPNVTYLVARVVHSFRDFKDEGSIDWDTEHTISVYLRTLQQL